MKKETKYFIYDFIVCFFAYMIVTAFVAIMISKSFGFGFIWGALTSLLFSGLTCVMMIKLEKKKEYYRDSSGIVNEPVLYDGRATYWYQTQIGLGGWIFLTKNKLCFVCHSFNFFKGIREIPYVDITKVTKGKRIRSIAIHSKTGIIEEFVVYGRNEWFHVLKDLGVGEKEMSVEDVKI